MAVERPALVVAGPRRAPLHACRRSRHSLRDDRRRSGRRAGTPRRRAHPAAAASPGRAGTVAAPARCWPWRVAVSEPSSICSSRSRVGTVACMSAVSALLRDDLLQVSTHDRQPNAPSTLRASPGDKPAFDDLRVGRRRFEDTLCEQRGSRPWRRPSGAAARRRGRRRTGRRRPGRGAGARRPRGRRGRAGCPTTSLRRASTMLPGVTVLAPDEVVAAADFVLLAVPDDALRPLVAGLADTGAWRAGSARRAHVGRARHRRARSGSRARASSPLRCIR